VVEQLVTRCLAKDPNQRFQSAGELAREYTKLSGSKHSSSSSIRALCLFTS